MTNMTNAARSIAPMTFVIDARVEVCGPFASSKRQGFRAFAMDGDRVVCSEWALTKAEAEAWVISMGGAVAMTSDAARLLEDLRECWGIEIDGSFAASTLTITSRGATFTYRGPDLSKLIKRAWAGERGDS
jgi:hypothetical protein